MWVILLATLRLNQNNQNGCICMKYVVEKKTYAGNANAAWIKFPFKVSVLRKKSSRNYIEIVLWQDWNGGETWFGTSLNLLLGFSFKLSFGLKCGLTILMLINTNTVEINSFLKWLKLHNAMTHRQVVACYA